MPRQLSIEDLNKIVGNRYHFFKVISFDHEEKSKEGAHYYYNCLCDCGNTFITHRRLIFKSNVKSCGCYALISSSINGKKRKKYNKYDLSGEYGIGYDSRGNKFYFDLEDYDKIKDVCWNKDLNGYMNGRKNATQVKIHRLIMNPSEDKVVDHINHNEADNRKVNLRVCTKQQNSMNRNIKGISYRKDSNKYRARIQKNGNKISIGSYDTIELAIDARKKAENKYFKEYGYHNSIEGSMSCQLGLNV